MPVHDRLQSLLLVQLDGVKLHCQLVRAVLLWHLNEFSQERRKLMCAALGFFR
jgi:hypothetical protein